MGDELSSAGPYRGPSSISYTSVAEARAGQGAEGQAAPAGTTPVPVERNDTISGLMSQAEPPLDWNNPEHREQFLRDNPQFRGRDPDLIYPGEVLYIRNAPVDANQDGVPDTPPDANGDGVPDPATDVDGDGIPDSSNSQQAAATTDAAIANLERARNAGNTDTPRGQGDNDTSYETQAVFDAIQGEVETGLREYIAANPNASPAELRAEANRLASQIQGRSQTAASFDDASMDYRTQTALNNVSAEQRGIDLTRVAPGTTVRDGPYTDASGPFEPGTSITLRDGSTVAINDKGYPYGGTLGLRPNPGTAAEAQRQTRQAVVDLANAQSMPDDPRTRGDKPEIVSARQTALGNAIQREIEVRLQAWLAENPGASDEEVAAQALVIGRSIQQREGGSGVVPTSTVEYRAGAAANAVNSRR